MIAGSALEAPAVVVGLDDTAVVGQVVEQGGCHPGITEVAGPFPEGQVGRDDDQGALDRAADEVEQEMSARLGEERIAELAEDDEVHAGQMIGEPALAAVAGLGLEPVDEVVEPPAGAGAVQLLAMARWVLPIPVSRPTRRCAAGQ